MDLVSLLKLVASRLESLKIPYMLTGGLAVSFWGLPRTTHDIDIVIESQKEDKEKIINIFKKDFYISPEAVDEVFLHLQPSPPPLEEGARLIEEAIKRRFTFNIIHFKTSLKIDFWLAKKGLFPAMEFKRRKKKEIFGKKIFIISPEDLILEKLIWHRESESTRHLEDIESILKISKPDLNYIKKWAIQQSTIKILNKIIKKK